MSYESFRKCVDSVGGNPNFDYPKGIEAEIYRDGDEYSYRLVNPADKDQVGDPYAIITPSREAGHWIMAPQSSEAHRDWDSCKLEYASEGRTIPVRSSN